MFLGKVCTWRALQKCKALEPWSPGALYTRGVTSLRVVPGPRSAQMPLRLLPLDPLLGETRFRSAQRDPGVVSPPSGGAHPCRVPSKRCMLLCSEPYAMAS